MALLYCGLNLVSFPQAAAAEVEAFRRVVPASTNLIPSTVAEYVLGLRRSY